MITDTVTLTENQQALLERIKAAKCGAEESELLSNHPLLHPVNTIGTFADLNHLVKSGLIKKGYICTSDGATNHYTASDKA